jgi:GNAT superfamily N-acetyltransferase
MREIRELEVSMTIEIRGACATDVPLLRELAHEIWFDHYPAIISWAQIHYMLERGYSTAVIEEEIARGVEWRIASVDGEASGFSASEATDREVKLHKLYVRRSARATGVGRALVDDLSMSARANDIASIYLTVNKRNRIAIRAYLKMGFAFRRAMRADIGFGFVMDDFEMARRV